MQHLCDYWINVTSSRGRKGPDKRGNRRVRRHTIIQSSSGPQIIEQCFYNNGAANAREATFVLATCGPGVLLKELHNTPGENANPMQRAILSTRCNLPRVGVDRSFARSAAQGNATASSASGIADLELAPLDDSWGFVEIRDPSCGCEAQSRVTAR